MHGFDRLYFHLSYRSEYRNILRILFSKGKMREFPFSFFCYHLLEWKISNIAAHTCREYINIICMRLERNIANKTCGKQVSFYPEAPVTLLQILECLSKRTQATVKGVSIICTVRSKS